MGLDGGGHDQDDDHIVNLVQKAWRGWLSKQSDAVVCEILGHLRSLPVRHLQSGLPMQQDEQLLLRGQQRVGLQRPLQLDGQVAADPELLPLLQALAAEGTEGRPLRSALCDGLLDRPPAVDPVVARPSLRNGCAVPRQREARRRGPPAVAREGGGDRLAGAGVGLDKATVEDHLEQNEVLADIEVPLLHQLDLDEEGKCSAHLDLNCQLDVFVPPRLQRRAKGVVDGHKSHAMLGQRHGLEGLQHLQQVLGAVGNHRAPHDVHHHAGLHDVCGTGVLAEAEVPLASLAELRRHIAYFLQGLRRHDAAGVREVLFQDLAKLRVGLGRHRRQPAAVDLLPEGLHQRRHLPGAARLADLVPPLGGQDEVGESGDRVEGLEVRKCAHRGEEVPSLTVGRKPRQLAVGEVLMAHGPPVLQATVLGFRRAASEDRPEAISVLLSLQGCPAMAVGGSAKHLQALDGSLRYLVDLQAAEDADPALHEVANEALVAHPRDVRR
mmetsp:Transcript_27311/g.88115  ORF Transcript_27311/g.88115 Transcript_27311/m.88115 type:complete len:495 (-) Transcript_27311:2517-4001(-)